MVRAGEALPEETGSNGYAQPTSQAPSPDPIAIENPSEADLAFAALQAKFDYTAPAARRLSSGR